MEDATWRADDRQLVDRLVRHFIEIGWIVERDVIGFAIHRIRFAYPILELEYEEKLGGILNYLGTLVNLRLIGRDGRFVYAHLHDMIQFGREVIAEYVGP